MANMHRGEKFASPHATINLPIIPNFFQSSPLPDAGIGSMMAKGSVKSPCGIRGLQNVHWLLLCSGRKGFQAALNARGLGGQPCAKHAA
jgi:hypothetical protein